MHKQRGKYRYLSVGGVGQYKQKEKYLWEGGQYKFFLLAATRGSGNLVVSGCGQDINNDLGLEQSVVVLGIGASGARF